MKVLVVAMALVALLSTGCARSADADSGEAVPSVIGMQLGEAKGELMDAGFKVGEVTPKQAGWDGVVSDQSPTAGSLAQPGARVDLEVEDGY